MSETLEQLRGAETSLRLVSACRSMLMSGSKKGDHYTQVILTLLRDRERHLRSNVNRTLHRDKLRLPKKLSIEVEYDCIGRLGHKNV